MKYYLNYVTALDPTNQYLVTHPHEPIVHDGLDISERDKDRHAYYDWHCSLSDTRYPYGGASAPRAVDPGGRLGPPHAPGWQV